MRKLLVLMIAAALTAVLPLQAAARAPLMVRGGGTGTFGADIDGDGQIDGSQFGLVVVIMENGAASGHFLCLMAGRSQILGLHLMSVQGPVTGGVLNADGSVMFSGTASVNLGNGAIFQGIPFQVTARPGGPGVGTMQLTVVGAFSDVPGDAHLGNGNYDLPVETVATGQIVMG